MAIIDLSKRVHEAAISKEQALIAFQKKLIGMESSQRKPYVYERMSDLMGQEVGDPAMMLEEAMLEAVCDVIELIDRHAIDDETMLVALCEGLSKSIENAFRGIEIEASSAARQIPGIAPYEKEKGFVVEDRDLAEENMVFLFSTLDELAIHCAE